MKEVVVHAPRSTMEHGWPGVSAVITVDGDRYDIFYRVSKGPLAAGAETFLAAALFPAMAVGAPIRVEAPLPPRFVARVMRIQEIFSSWYQDLHIVPIEALPWTVAPAPIPVQDSRGAACFFSGGVDSFYSVLKHSDLAALITVYGWDIRLGSQDRRKSVSSAVHDVASELKKEIIEVETNVRDLLDIYTSWQLYGDGAAVAGVALLLSPFFHTIYVAAGRHYLDFHPVGITPLGLDLWSTPELDIASDGGEATRYQKVVRLGQVDAALRHLRVCWEHRNPGYNCGECPKCLHTMVDLKLAGALDRCTTFARPLTPDAVRHVSLHSPADRLYFEEALAVAEQTGVEPELTLALREMLGGELPAQSAAPHSGATAEQLLNARRRAARLQSELNVMRASSSWRLTAPLRRAGLWLQPLRRKG